MPKFGHLLYLLTIVYRGMFPHRDIVLYESKLKDDYLIVLWHTNHIMDSHFFANTKFAEGPHLCCSMHHCTSHISTNK